MVRAHIVILIIGVLLCTASVCAQVEQSIIVDAAGEALVVTYLNNSGTHTLTLPEDVSEFHVKNALYLRDNQELEIAVGEEDTAVVLYTTNTLTQKKQDVWTITVTPPEEGTKVTLNLHPDATIEQSAPPAFVQPASFKKLVWSNPQVPLVATYTFQPSSPPTNVPDLTPPPLPKSSSKWGWIAVIAILIGAGIFLLIRKQKERTPEPEVTHEEVQEAAPAKKETSNKTNVIKTLPHNEAKIVQLITDAQGEIKRNELERQSQIAKSSLAASLNNLEKKSIIEIDRTHVVHKVRFTEWFKEL